MLKHWPRNTRPWLVRLLIDTWVWDKFARYWCRGSRAWFTCCCASSSCNQTEQSCSLNPLTEGVLVLWQSRYLDSTLMFCFGVECFINIYIFWHASAWKHIIHISCLDILHRQATLCVRDTIHLVSGMSRHATSYLCRVQD